MVWTKLYIENNLPFSTSKYKSIFVREITFLLKWQINFVAKHLRILCKKATAGMIQSLFLVFWLVQCVILDGFWENWIPSIFSFFVWFSFCDAKCRYRISSIVWHRKKFRNLENLSIFSVNFEKSQNKLSRYFYWHLVERHLIPGLTIFLQICMRQNTMCFGGIPFTFQHSIFLFCCRAEIQNKPLNEGLARPSYQSRDFSSWSFFQYLGQASIG